MLAAVTLQYQSFTSNAGDPELERVVYRPVNPIASAIMLSSRQGVWPSREGLRMLSYHFAIVVDGKAWRP